MINKAIIVLLLLSIACNCYCYILVGRLYGSLDNLKGRVTDTEASYSELEDKYYNLQDSLAVSISNTPSSKTRIVAPFTPASDSLKTHVMQNDIDKLSKQVEEANRNAFGSYLRASEADDKFHHFLDGTGRGNLYYNY